MIREALLAEERAAVAAFLVANGLKAPIAPTETLYEEEDGRVVATVSRTGEVVSHLAVAPDRRGEALASHLVGELVSRMNAEGLSRRLVFTKTDYATVFAGMHFRMVAASSHAAILEQGEPGIEAELASLRTRIERRFDCPVASLDLGAIVVNCNPMTKGHLGLIAHAAGVHRALLVLVLEEDRSVFTFDERIAMVRSGCAALDNVLVLPSTRYVVSQLTFPSYFLKTMDEHDEEAARLDAAIFRDRFMPSLHIVKRWIGTETDPMMKKYNAILEEALGDRIGILVRYEQGGSPISASRVRRLLDEGRIEDALDLVPEANRAMLRAIAEAKCRG
jgi:[citrate (pro-3S)-lyase] ligase